MHLEILCLENSYCLNFFSWKSGLDLHWISMTSLSKHLEVRQSNGNVGPQTQFCKNTELFGSFRKVKGWLSPRPQAVHTDFRQVLQARLHERVRAQKLLKTGIFTVEEFHCHSESCSWLERLLNTVVLDLCQVSQPQNGTPSRAMWMV